MDETIPRIAACKRGFERTVPAPADWTEKSILVWSSEPDVDMFFPECEDCKPDEDSIMISPDDDGVFHHIKVCRISFHPVKVHCIRLGGADT
jgi:hypothetical protein